MAFLSGRIVCPSLQALKSHKKETDLNVQLQYLTTKFNALISSKLAFFIDLKRAVIGPPAGLTGR